MNINQISNSDRSFIQHKAKHCATYVVMNASRMSPETSYHTLPQIPLDADGTRKAVIIGAGWSLPDDLSMYQDNVTFCTNSSLQAALNRGLVPTYVISRESIDMSPMFKDIPDAAKKAITAIVDCQVNPATWDALLDGFKDLKWFIPTNTLLLGLASDLRHRPLYSGPSALTSAVSLAASMGATQIETLGATRAFSEDGRAYAKGSPWEKVKLEFCEELAPKWYATISGREEQAKLHKASGQRAPLPMEVVVPLKAFDGTRRWALEPTLISGCWLEEFASKHPDITCRQHGYENDIALAGWSEKVKVIDFEIPYLTARESIMNQACRADEIGKAVLMGLDLPNSIDATDIIDYTNAYNILQVRESKIRDPRLTIPAISRFQIDTAKDLAEKLK